MPRYIDTFKTAIGLFLLGLVFGIVISQGFTDLSYKPFVKGADYVF